jgi:hypothetical protein
MLLSTLLRLTSDHKPLSSCLDHPTREKYAQALVDGANLTYERGLLRKGVGLCHGVSGSVFTLLSAADYFDEVHPGSGEREKWLARATHLALLGIKWPELTEKGEMTTPDRPWSLYEGLAGMCTAWAAMAHRLGAEAEGKPVRTLGLPGYDDLVVTWA